MRLWLLSALLLAGPALAELPPVPASRLESAQQSWLIDHTHSGLGGEFFRAFAAAWRNEERGSLVIAVEEGMGQPFAHRISIRAGNRLLLQTQLYPSQRGNIARIAEGSAASAAARLRHWQAAREQQF